MKKWPIIVLLACGAILTAPATPALAVTKVDEFVDVSPSHWAYKALKDLVEKYGVFKEWPERTYDGYLLATRYDAAFALYQVTRYAEQHLPAATTPEEAPVVTREDLLRINRLQEEFKPELQKLKLKADKLEQRIRKQERGLKISGEVEAAFRNRFTVVESGSSFGVIDPGATSSYYTLFTSNNLNPFTHSLRLKMLAQLDPTFRFDGQLLLLNSGAGRTTAALPFGQAGNHWYDEGTAPLGLFVQKALVTWDAYDFARDGVGFTLKVGLMNLDEVVHPGTSLLNRFTAESWVGHGYGLVGLGAHKAAATDATCAIFDAAGNVAGVQPGCTSPFVYTGHLLPRFWGSGIDASGVDPNSRHYNRLPSLAVGTSITFMDKGALRLAGGLEQGPFGRYSPTGRFAGAIPGALYLEQFQDDLAPGFTDISGRLWHDTEVFSGGTNLVPPSFYDDNYWVGEVTFDLRKLETPLPLSMKASGQFYNHDPFFGYSTTRHEISAVFDFDIGMLEPEAGTIGWTLQFSKSVKEFGTFIVRPSIISSAVVAEDFFHTGFGWGIGFKAAMTDLFNFSSASRGDYSLGAYIWMPKYGQFPGMLLALQQSFGPGIVSGTPALPTTVPSSFNQIWFANAGGITVQFPFRNLGGTPVDAVVELDSLFEGSLFDFRNVATDLSVIATYRF